MNDPSAAPGPPATGGPIQRALPWLFLTLGVAWAAVVHYGLGPRPDFEVYWWSPRGQITNALYGSSYESLISGLSPGFYVFWAPSLLLAIAAFATTRSSLLRCAAVVTACATAMFLFYALASGVTRFAWELFHWRASGTMLGLGLAVGAALVSPWLAASWLRLGWAARLAILLPIVAVVVAIERNVTGTNPELRFAISPWPVVQVFGFETLGTLIASQAAGIATALFGLSLVRRRNAPTDVPIGVAMLLVGLAIPGLWLLLGAGGLLPFRADPSSYTVAVLFCAAGSAVAALAGIRLRADGLRRRAIVFGTAAALVAVPLFAGTAWARLDYTRTRDDHAQQLIEALQRYYDREYVYPDELAELVESGDIEEVPAPTIGFSWLSEDHEFTYQAFGTSYLLEFPAPRWVQCAYNPPYPDEEEELDPDSDDYEEYEGDLGSGSWSCPRTPPELW